MRPTVQLGGDPAHLVVLAGAGEGDVEENVGNGRGLVDGEEVVVVPSLQR